MRYFLEEEIAKRIEDDQEEVDRMVKALIGSGKIAVQELPNDKLVWYR